LNQDQSNAVLFPAWFSGGSEDLVPLAGPDRLVNPAPARDFAPLTRTKLFGLTGDGGHLANRCESARLYPAVRAFLAGA
jgi:hypothetical protein